MSGWSCRSYASIPKNLPERLGTFMVYLGGNHLSGAVRLSTLPGSRVPVYLIEQGLYFARSGLYQAGGRPYSDNLERFAFFSLSALEGVAQTGWLPDVIHCNDWHTALAPAFLKVSQRVNPACRGIPTVFTIHNLIYQGRFPGAQFYQTGLPERLFTPDYLEYYGDVNVMKAGIAFANRISTVSPQYAEEIQTPEGGWGLDGYLRTRSADISGILNGIDYAEWNPAEDPLIPAHFSRKNLRGKSRCKSALQTDLGLPDKNVPLFGCVSRLVYEKGIDLLIDSLETLFREESSSPCWARGLRAGTPPGGGLATAPGTPQGHLALRRSAGPSVLRGVRLLPDALALGTVRPVSDVQPGLWRHSGRPVHRRPGQFGPGRHGPEPYRRQGDGRRFPRACRGRLRACGPARPRDLPGSREAPPAPEGRHGGGFLVGTLLARIRAALSRGPGETMTTGDCIIETASPEATRRLGAALAAMLPRGAVVALRGELATGKTCLVSGMAGHFAEADYVHSPTFTLVNQYGQDPALLHVDL